MKKVFYLFLTLLMISIFGLVACGGSEGQASSQESSSASEVTSTPATKGDAALGKEKYGTICTACHGPGGEGIQGLGKNLITSEFVAEKSDDELVEFIKVGRAPDDPLNTTGVSMPPKGGNPALTDDDLYDLVAFIRTLQE